MIVGASHEARESMTIDDLFALREQMQEVLNAKLEAKKVELERRLQQLNQPSKVFGYGEA